MKTLIEKVTNEKSIKYTSFNLKGVHTLENSILGSFGCVHGHSQVGKIGKSRKFEMDPNSSPENWNLRKSTDIITFLSFYHSFPRKLPKEMLFSFTFSITYQKMI